MLSRRTVAYTRGALHYVRGVNPTERPDRSCLVGPLATTRAWEASTKVCPLRRCWSIHRQSAGQLEGTCAFAFNLDAWSHVRGNAGFMQYGRKTYAVVIERC